MNTEPFIIEITFKAPVSKVWNAITDKDEMKKWYFDLKEFKSEVGFEFSFYGGEPGKKQYLHLCKISEVIEGKKLTHSWKFEEYEGESYISWELFDEGENTRIKLTHSGLHTFPADNPDLKRKNFAAGWTSILGSSLKGYLEIKDSVI